MNWPRAVLTDSGGYQLFSLSKQVKLSEEGAEFRSYVDGTRIQLTPEASIGMQGAIGSDIMMALDHCVASTSDKETTQEAMHLTYRWAKRSLAARGDSPQALFGIVQGGCFHDLRRESVAQITSLDFDGFAIGGVAVGEERSIRDDIVEFTAELLPVDRPRYLMGVGTPLDVLEGVWRGMDMFDCIIPTAMAEQGVAFTSVGRLRLLRGIYAGLDVHEIQPRVPAPSGESQGTSRGHPRWCPQPRLLSYFDDGDSLSYHGRHFRRVLRSTT
jgi:queuine tRNA-ribosyltransferase